MNQVLDGIDKVVTAISGVLYMPWVPFLLLAAGLFFTFRSKFIQVRLLGESFRVVSEKPKTKGGISSVGALMVSTASRVGTGNIVGVSTAICMGGYGAVFHALSAPGKYAACGSFSGAIEKVDLTQCIGSAEKYDILSLLKRRVGEGAKLPLFYLSCGENDFIYDNSVRLEQAMTNLGVAHRWESVEGFTHEWRFWDMQLERFIKWLPRTDYYKGKVRNV